MAHPKGQLIERLAKLGTGKPEFRTANTGPGHQPTFISDVLVDGEVYGTGQGSTKREAERLAAEEALEYLDRNAVQEEPQAKKGAKGGRAGAGAKKAKDENESDANGKSRGGKKAARGEAGKPAAARSDDGGKPKQAASAPAKSKEAATPETTEDGEGAFEGPWPVFENVLEAVIEVANERIDEDLEGEEARVAIRDFTLTLYKEILENLGEVVEEDE